MNLKYTLCHSSVFFLMLILSMTSYASPPNEETTSGRFVWIELFTSNVDASIDFYSKTFGWQAKENIVGEKTTYLLLNKDKPIARVVPRKPKDPQSNQALWVGYLSTENIEETLDHAKKLGGHVITDDSEKKRHKAIISDPQGGIVGLMVEDSTPSQGMNHKNKLWVWSQLFSHNLQQATQFYTQLFGYIAKNTEYSPDKQVVLLTQNTVTRAAIAPLPEKMPNRNRWVGFISVPNLTDTLNKAKQYGANVIYAPRPEVLDGRISVILDPNGALVGLIEKESTIKEATL